MAMLKAKKLKQMVRIHTLKVVAQKLLPQVMLKVIILKPESMLTLKAVV